MSQERDDALFKAAGRECNACGTTLIPPYHRDLVWFCDDYREAKQIYEALRDIGYKPKIDY